MQNTNLWMLFPSHLEPPALRSLSLAFILEELLQLFEPPKEALSLDKLCYYCTVLIKASKREEDCFLQNEITEMRISILQFQSDHRLFHEQLRSFFSALLPFLYHARTDENILIRLLENRERFNLYLGNNTIEKLIQSYSPSGTDHLKTIISEGLTRRGFVSFLAEKEHLINAIEWECPCLTKQH